MNTGKSCAPDAKDNRTGITASQEFLKLLKKIFTIKCKEKKIKNWA